MTMKKIFLINIFLFLLSGNIYANERSECLIAVEKGREIINVNDMKVYSYNLESSKQSLMLFQTLYL